MQSSHAIPGVIDVPKAKLKVRPDDVARRRTDLEGASALIFKAQLLDPRYAVWPTVAVKVLKMQPNKDVTRQHQVRHSSTTFVPPF